MLVLTRKQNEKIQIGENITVTVLRMKGKTVRLGIQAPAEYGVVRGELIIDLEDSQVLENAAESGEKPRSESSARYRRTGEVNVQEARASWPSAPKCNPTERAGVASPIGLVQQQWQQ